MSIRRPADAWDESRFPRLGEQWRRLLLAEYAGGRCKAGELACKPDSVPRRRGLSNGDAAATIHLDTPLPGASSGLPADSGEQPSNACAAALSCGLLDLASGGVCLATPVTWNAGALLPHRFTLTATRAAVCFLWHFPASHLGLLLAITLLCEVRTFLDSTPDLSDRHEPRPPGQLVRDDQRYSLQNLLASAVCLLHNLFNHCLLSDVGVTLTR
jgi:hypothetical protein